MDALDFSGLTPFRLNPPEAGPGCKVSDQSAGPIDDLLSAEAMAFLTALHRRFQRTRQHLLRLRAERAYLLSRGDSLGFLATTADVRSAKWRVAQPPKDLTCRWIELTGPAEPKMIVNALNSSADVFMADLEDALSPSWGNVVSGHRALRDAASGRLVYRADSGKEYIQKTHGATLFVRPRGWHLDEPGLEIDGETPSASLVDFGLAFIHGARALLARGSGPYYYLPKLESHLEARLWNDVFVFAQSWLGLPRGTIRATVLIETLPAAFEMDEILFELREHSVGLNAGRWDYIFSAIKKLALSPTIDVLLPERSQVTMRVPFLSSYAELLVSTCRRRGAQAIGGMSAFIPSRQNPTVTEAALKKVQDDKRREAQLGFDGSWVAHPDLIPIARAEFAHSDLPNVRTADQPDSLWTQEDEVRWAQRLTDFRVEGAQVTEAGVRTNLRAALSYIERWLDGTGAVAIDHLMEDAATAEISRIQLWHWLRKGDTLVNRGWWRPEQRLSEDLLLSWLAEEASRLCQERAVPHLDSATRLLTDLITNQDLAEFLTSKALTDLRAIETDPKPHNRPPAKESEGCQKPSTESHSL